MTLIQLDIPTELSKSVGIYRLENDFVNKGEVIISILEEFFNRQRAKPL